MSYMICKDLVPGYNGRGIVSKLDFSVNKGDYLYVVGENGVGKSTLIKTLLSLIPPVTGEIILSEGFERSDIGYLPQRTDAQKDFPATVQEVVFSGILAKSKNKWFIKKEEKNEALERLKKLGIYDLKNKCFADLSGGQQQKVLLARALTAAGRLLVLDEPVTGLDPIAQKDMYNLINDLNKNGVTIIMISHDIHAVKYATHVLHMSNEGNFFGTADEYKESEFWLMYHKKKEAVTNEH